jgi:hypothetical protein
MASTAHRLALLVGIVALAALPRIGFADTADIGTAASIATAVTGQIETQTLTLKTGDLAF